MRNNAPLALAVTGKRPELALRDIQTAFNELLRRVFERVFVRVERSNDLSVATDTETAIAWESQSADTLEGQASGTGMWAPGSATRLTADRAGTYLVEASVQFEANACGLRRVTVKKNGAVWAAQQSPNAGTDPVTVLAVCLVELEPGDYVECLAYHEAGLAIAVKKDADRTHFAAALVK